MTSTQPSSQASDEPMRDAFEAHIRSRNAKELFVARWPDGTYKHHGTERMWTGWQAAMNAQAAVPRATADVERLEFIMQSEAWIAWSKDGESCRVFHRDEDGDTGPIMGWIPEAWHHDPRLAIDAAIAATKGAKP